VTPGAATKAASVVPYEFHRDLDSYLSSTPEGNAKSLQQVIEYNSANPVEGLKFQQTGLLAAEATETSNETTKATYEENLSKGQTEDKAVIDNIINNGTPSETADDYAGLMVPSGSALVGIADRAGYPVLTVPAGFAVQNSSTGGNPVGVVFIDKTTLHSRFVYHRPSQLPFDFCFSRTHRRIIHKRDKREIDHSRAFSRRLTWRSFIGSRDGWRRTRRGRTGPLRRRGGNGSAATRWRRLSPLPG